MQRKPRSIFPKPVYLGAPVRSPIGKFGGALARFPASQLAALTLRECVSRATEAAPADRVYLGHARQAGCGPNPARQAVVFGGLPESVPAVTINQACASGMTAVFSALESIVLGKAKSVFAGGVESMSNTPYLLTDARWGLRMGHREAVDGMNRDGFFCPMADMLMGETVEFHLAKVRGISRGAQDEYAIRSQQRADAAWREGRFDSEVFQIDDLPLEDEHRRPDTTLVKLGKLPSVFDRERGTVTAGNSSGITDGAAFVHVSGQRGEHAVVEVLDYETVALDPKLMGLGPVPATNALLERHGLEVGDLEVVEINEAFAAQVLACQQELKIPEEKLNPNGGAIAIGHPIGATGARITVTLMNQLRGKSGALGIATLCVSGGQGAAILLRAL